jgi:hypothetical protein
MARVFRVIPWLGGAENDEGLEVFGPLIPDAYGYLPITWPVDPKGAVPLKDNSVVKANFEMGVRDRSTVRE